MFKKMTLYLVIFSCAAVQMPVLAHVAALSHNIGIVHHILSVLLASTGGVGWVFLSYKLARFTYDMREDNADFLQRHPHLESSLILGEVFFFAIISPLLSGFIGYQVVKLIE